MKTSNSFSDWNPSIDKMSDVSLISVIFLVAIFGDCLIIAYRSFLFSFGRAKQSLVCPGRFVKGNAFLWGWSREEHMTMNPADLRSAGNDEILQCDQLFSVF